MREIKDARIILMFVGLIGLNLLNISALWTFTTLALMIYGAIMNEKAYKDALTKVHNRAYYNKIINRKNLKNSSIQVLDIDYFKRINDSFGHDAGDYILQEFANVIQNSIRRTDILCRLGGEEFVIISPNTSKDKSESIAQRICEKTSKHNFSYNGHIIPVTVSIGVASTCAIEEKTPVKLFELADKALYSAKNSGRNKVMAA